MEITNIYIPSHVFIDEQNLKKFYDYYETLVTSQQFEAIENIQLKDKLIKKAVELKEPNLKKFVENNL